MAIIILSTNDRIHVSESVEEATAVLATACEAGQNLVPFMQLSNTIGRQSDNPEVVGINALQVVAVLPEYI